MAPESPNSRPRICASGLPESSQRGYFVGFQVDRLVPTGPPLLTSERALRGNGIRGPGGRALSLTSESGQRYTNSTPAPATMERTVGVRVVRMLVFHLAVVRSQRVRSLQLRSCRSLCRAVQVPRARSKRSADTSRAWNADSETGTLSQSSCTSSDPSFESPNQSCSGT